MTSPTPIACERAAVCSPAGQLELCMIGDSISWALKGDYWRRYLLERIPELAFVGSHTACLGYSHAGEGGNSTTQVLARIRDPENVPDSRNYHVLIGVNDHKASHSSEDAERLATQTFQNIVAIVRQLESRPRTERIFLGTLLPCSDPVDPELMKYRDLANQAVNHHLRLNLESLFPSGKVILVDYETPLRRLPNWRPLIMLHPSCQGYRLISDILAPQLLAHAVREAPLAGPSGVPVTNLWDDRFQQTIRPVIPGCYVLSLEPTASCSDFSLTLETRPEGNALAFPFRREFLRHDIPAGARLEFPFFTGYEGYGYSQARIGITHASCDLRHVQLEKMRPSKRASCYGSGSFLDCVSPQSAGELRREVRSGDCQDC